MQLELLTRQSCALIKEVGQFIAEQLGKVQDGNIETKSKNSLVSYVDKTAESRLVAGLAKILPSSVFLTEEDTVEDQEGEWQWIIDPLDGTTNFLHQVPFFSISVALRHRDELVMGIVYEVMHEECFYAWKDGGAYLNDLPIKVSSAVQLEETLLATGFPYYDYSRMESYLDVFQVFMKRTRGIRRFGSAALDLAYVACGRFDGYYEYSIQSWDIAAGSFIVREAGGKVTTFNGQADFLFSNEVLAAGQVIHQEMLEVIKPMVEAK